MNWNDIKWADVKITISDGNKDYNDQDGEQGKQEQKSSEIGQLHYCVDGCGKQFDVEWNFE